MDEKESRKLLYRNIMNDLLNNNMAASGYLGKKIKISPVNVIDLYVLYETNKSSLEKVKSFNNYFGQINYIFKVLEELSKQL
jgi:CRISPR/Cas system-associated protein Cas5 (RAMP superfamily)